MVAEDATGAPGQGGWHETPPATTRGGSDVGADPARSWRPAASWTSPPWQSATVPRRPLLARTHRQLPPLRAAGNGARRRVVSPRRTPPTTPRAARRDRSAGVGGDPVCHAGSGRGGGAAAAARRAPRTGPAPGRYRRGRVARPSRDVRLRPQQRAGPHRHPPARHRGVYLRLLRDSEGGGPQHRNHLYSAAGSASNIPVRPLTPGW